jgi:signal transduction histidine kinase/CheY-like chemotaxis protein
LVVLIHSSAEQVPLAVWFLSTTLVTVLRYAHASAYLAQEREPAEARRWGKQFAVGALIAGSLWGWGAAQAILTSQHLPTHWFFVTAILIGTPAIAIFSLSSLLPAYLAFILTFLVPWGIYSIYLGGEINVLNGILAIAYTAGLFLIARRVNLDARAGVLQQLEINQLVNDLYRSNDETRLANQELRREIEARAIIEKDLREAKSLAESANKAKSQFLANMSHEIRTPMNGVLGMTELLLDAGLSEKQLEFARVAHSSGKNLLRIIDDILDFSKIEAGKLELETIDFDLRQVLEDVIGMFSEQAQTAGLELALAIDPAVHTQLRGDPDRLRQIVSNLAGNAIKFTAHGKVAVHVRESTARAGTALLRVEVSDTGIGIDAQSLEHIFDPFRQADGSTTRRFGGTGLGLSICKQIVELLGGHIGVNSTPGVGSRFWFGVPFEMQAAAAPRLGQQEPQAQSSSGYFRHGAQGVNPPMRWLVAEDNQVNQLIAQAMLSKLGWDCDLVENGQEVIDALRQKRYAGVLMDCQMPVMDGFAAARAIRAMEAEGGQAQHLPIIALTAHAMEGDSEKCLEAGMDGYVAKPYSLTELQQALDRVFSTARGRSMPNANGAPKKMA